MNPAQRRTEALAIIDKNGSSMVSNHTNASTNEIHVSTVHSMLKDGLVETFHGPDGTFVRRFVYVEPVPEHVYIDDMYPSYNEWRVNTQVHKVDMRVARAFDNYPQAVTYAQGLAAGLGVVLVTKVNVMRAEHTWAAEKRGLQFAEIQGDTVTLFDPPRPIPGWRSSDDEEQS